MGSQFHSSCACTNRCCITVLQTAVLLAGLTFMLNPRRLLKYIPNTVACQDQKAIYLGCICSWGPTRLSGRQGRSEKGTQHVSMNLMDLGPIPASVPLVSACVSLDRSTRFIPFLFSLPCYLNSYNHLEASLLLGPKPAQDWRMLVVSTLYSTKLHSAQRSRRSYRVRAQSAQGLMDLMRTP